MPLAHQMCALARARQDDVCAGAVELAKSSRRSARIGRDRPPERTNRAGPVGRGNAESPDRSGPGLSHEYPRQDSNLRFRLRRAALYPLSYGGPGSGSMHRTVRFRAEPTGPQIP